MEERVSKQKRFLWALAFLLAHCMVGYVAFRVMCRELSGYTDFKVMLVVIFVLLSVAGWIRESVMAFKQNSAKKERGVLASNTICYLIDFGFIPSSFSLIVYGISYECPDIFYLTRQDVVLMELVFLISGLIEDLILRYFVKSRYHP